MTEVSGTTPPRPGEELDARAVSAFLADHLGVEDREIGIRQFPGGASNLTYLVTAGDQNYVLRRPPPGTKARSAHDMGREFRILSRIHEAFPYAPRPLAYCEDPAPLGEPFYVMEQLPGLILRRDLPPDLAMGPAEARALCENLVAVHAELHDVDYAAVGLDELGHPDGYVARQVSGWSKRYRNARTDDVPDNEALMAWLAEHQPGNSGPGALIHNDYKFDNVVLSATDEGWRISGVLDWEMATLGDPLMDLGASLAYWVQADDPPVLQQIRMLPTHVPGMLTRRELIEQYLEVSGRQGGRFDFYYAYGLFRLAAIVQQIYYRYVQGQTTNPRFAEFGGFCTALSGVAQAVAGGKQLT
jgi:aminoglycoside phosphotransferase (APT) family kinase protein